MKGVRDERLEGKGKNKRKKCERGQQKERVGE